MQLPWRKQDPSMEDFRTQNWNTLSERERLRSLQFYENSLAQEQGRNPRKVARESDRQLGGAFGRYDLDSSKKIYINQTFLRNKDNSNYDWNSYNAMNTVAHEGRHAYQDDCIKGIASPDTCGISSAQLESWKINNKSYTGFDNDPVRFLEYRFQPMEDDAFQYGYNKLDGLREVYKNDSSYQQYMNYICNINVHDAGIATDYFGTEFQKTIENRIRNNYQAEYGYSKSSHSNSLAKEYSMGRASLNSNGEGNLFQNQSAEKKNSVNESRFPKVDKNDLKNRGHTEENLKSVEKKAVQESESSTSHRENFRTESNKSVSEKERSSPSHANVDNTYTSTQDLARPNGVEGGFYQATLNGEVSGDSVKREILKEKESGEKEGEKLSTGKGNEANRNLEKSDHSKDMWMGM